MLQVLHIRLYSEITPSRSKLLLKDSCALIKLYKAVPNVEWPALSKVHASTSGKEQDVKSSDPRAAVTADLVNEEAASATSRPEVDVAGDMRVRLCW